ncbi:mycothiol transferase [Sporosarcina sp. SAFN-015]|uniref:mycothiol transferase n=1 Tax=Sporosarcina sp. SAFN-015 TaxID=3387274 RepID=UPI003F7DC2FE
MNKETLFIIDKKEGLSAEFGKLVSMMDYTRATTIDEVKDLSVDELDFLYADDGNSIGMLLAHFVSVEKAYQIATFENRDFTEEDIDRLNPGLDLGDHARETIKGHAIDYYLHQLEETRKETIEKFKSLPDAWLFEQEPFWYDLPANNFFKWFHVFEDELNHRGQIRLIKKMMKKA